jgi:PAS domain S-box-containing protein
MKIKMPKKLVHSVLFGPLCLILLIWQLFAPAQAQQQMLPDAKVNLPSGQEATGVGIPVDLSKKHVLLLHAYTYETASSIIMDPIFMKGFKDAGFATFNLHFEFMDLAKRPDTLHRREFAKYLDRKFEKRPIDLIIALHSPALYFLVEEGKNLFPGVPVINVIAASEFLAYEDLRSAYERRMLALKRTFVILPYSLDVDSTVKSILNLRPDTRKLVVISGSGFLDITMEQAVRRGLRVWQGRLPIEYFEALPLEEILKRVATLVPETAILFTNFGADPDGRVHSPPEVVRRISEAASAPVFGLFDTLLENGGIVGGVMPTFRGEAIRAVQQALEILRGRAPTEPVTISRPHFIPMFDWEQLKRWGLKENRLPPGSMVLNRPKTIWTEYKGLVIVGIAIFLAQTFLVIGLLVQRRLKRKAELSVRQKTEELDRFFNVSLDILCIANTEGYFLRLNPAAERILGYTREELISKPFLDFVHPDDLDRTREAISALASQQKVFSIENRYRCKDGTYRWLQWSSAPAGNLIYAAARDVTDRKQAEEALRQRNESIETILEQAPIGFAVHTIDDGVGRFVSARFEEIYGVQRGTIDSHYTFFDKVWPNHPDLREEIRRRVVADMTSGDACRMRWENVPVPLRSGKTRYITAMNIPVLDQNLMVSTVQDVTERKEAEEALKKSEERFRMLIETMNEGFGVQNEKGVWTYVNDQLCGMLRHLPGDVVGRPVTEFLDEANQSVLAEEIERQRKGKYSPYELTWTCHDGRKVTTIVSPKPIFNPEGSLKEVFSVITNISQRKRVEEELRTYQERLEEMVKVRTAELVMARDQADVANRAKSTFLANMSHELRTPLNSILGITQLLERDVEFPSQHRDALKILSRSGSYLLELINDVLEMSKIEAGKTTLDATSFDPRSFLGDLEEMVRLRANQKGLTLLFEYSSPLSQYIETDVRKLRQILVNLLSNAIKFTEEGRVTLRVALKEGGDTVPEAKASLAHLKFEIEDTGIGIAQEDMQRIFEPFVQVNPGRAAREGTGLGLTLSRMFIELLGGEMTVRSQVGRGSIFAFDIPVKLAEGAIIRTQEGDRRMLGLMPGQPSYRLLVVDDSIENRFVLRRLLEQGGFIVLEASGGQETVDLYESGRPDLIWMDLRMPGMDGYEAAQRIREAERGRGDEEGKEVHTPIIALTAGVMENQSIAPLSGVFDDWVYKPFREAEIFGMLEKHLGVQFVYQPLVGPVAADQDRVKGVTPSDLAVLPVEWLKEFFRMLRRGRSSQLIDLINRISAEHGELARALAESVRIYRFHDLMVATEGALEEASDE